MNSEYILSDQAISHIAKLLQLAIFTGTDIVDNFRLIRLEPSTLNPQELVLTKEYEEQGDAVIVDLIEKAEEEAEKAKDQEMIEKFGNTVTSGEFKTN